jgi:light-independent protochlorophyllide reductase subunit B
MGWEGANVIFDSWVHPLMMGLEEHLIGMFREDFEFSEGHMSHLHTAPASVPEPVSQPANHEPIASPVAASTIVPTSLNGTEHLLSWSEDGEAELKKIPFFVRGKIKKNTEKFASDRGITSITVETLYDAKAQIGK